MERCSLLERQPDRSASFLMRSKHRSGMLADSIASPFDAEYLSLDLPGHSAELSPEGNYTIVSIFKEETYRANYSCAVDSLYTHTKSDNTLNLLTHN